ncbi:MAG: metallophosphoesterase [Stagnimonas sp.]|nr:metallophosphoesterase [Stagnimonas sp.]
MQSPPIIRRLSPNHRGRDFYIGDLHGCTEHLARLMEHVRFDGSMDRVISVGDLVDRGPDSLAASSLIEEPWFFAVLGNHEICSLAVLHIDPYTQWESHLRYREYVEWHARLTEDQRAKVIGRLSALPLGLEVEQPDGSVIGVIHAHLRVRPGWPALNAVTAAEMTPHSTKLGSLVWDAIRGREQASLETALGLRNPQGYERWIAAHRRQLQRQACRTSGIDLLISGHVITPHFEPVSIANRLSIDTGVYLPLGRLTMVEPTTRRYWQVGWRKNLKEPQKHVHCGQLLAPSSAWDVRLSIRKILADAEAR